MHQKYFFANGRRGGHYQHPRTIGFSCRSAVRRRTANPIDRPFSSGDPPDIVARPLAQMLGDGLGVHLHNFRNMKLLSGAMPCACSAQK
jgi:hypothetical protein